MKISFVRSTVFALLAAASLQANAASDAAGSVSVSDAYVRAVPAGQTNTAAFMKLNNGSADHHSLVGAKSDAAKMVELHTHVEEGGMMKMRQIEKIDIHPHSETVLQPGGLHVMMMGLTGELKDGDHAMITLIFADGSEKMVHAPVRKMQMQMDMKEDMPMEHQHGHMH